MISHKSNRSYGIDALRALAAMAVVVFHFTNGHQGFIPDGNIVKIIGSFGNLGVAAFFVISGFVIPYSMDRMGYQFPRDVRTFVVRRFSRIYPAYIFSLAITVALSAASSKLPFTNASMPPITLTNIVGNLTYLAPWMGVEWLCPIYWSLAIEVQFYVAMALCAPLLLQTNKLALNAALLGIACLAFLPANETFLFWYLPLFGIGISRFLGETGRLTPFEASAQAIGFTIIAFMTMGTRLATTGALVYLLLLIPMRRQIPLIGGICAMSYSIYLLHLQTGGRVINLAMRLPHTPLVQTAAMIGAFAVALVAAYFLWRFIEKPFTQLERKR